MNDITCLDVLRAGQNEVRELLEETPGDTHETREFAREIERLRQREPYAMHLDRKEGLR